MSTTHYSKEGQYVYFKTDTYGLYIFIITSHFYETKSVNKAKKNLLHKVTIKYLD